MNTTKRSLRNLAVLAAVTIAAPAWAIVVVNNSFETAPYPPSPGYGTIPGWSSTDTTRSGVNPASDNSAPFLNSLPVPDGTHIAFIQNAAPTADRSISQTVSGLVPGKKYTVQVYVDERGNGVVAASPYVTLGGSTVVAQYSDTRTATFRRIISDPFTAGATTAALVLGNGNTFASGDNSALFDNVSVSRSTPVLSNGPQGQRYNGFEYPAINSGSFSYGAAGGGWTFTASLPNGGGSGVARSGGGFNPATPLEGQQVAFLQGPFSAGTQPTITGTFSGFEVGTEYTLSFLMSARTAGQGNDFRVLLDGTPLTFTGSPTLLPAGTAYTTVTSDIIANFVGSTHTLQFLGLDTLGGDRTAFIDDVRFNFVRDVPEPSTLMLVGIGGGLLLKLRRKTSKA